MKIIYIASAKSIHSARWIKFFVINSEIEVIWINTSKPNSENINEFNELKSLIKIYNSQNILYFFKIIFILLFENKNIIHLHYLGWHSLLSLFIGPKNNLILTPWGSDLLQKDSILKKIWFSFLFKKAKYIICDSNRLKNASLKYGAKEEIISVLMFGIDTNIYKKSRLIFSNNNEIVIGSNRKLEKIYDLNTLLLAAKILCKKRKDIKFLIAGDGSLKTKIVSFIFNNKLQNRIKLLGLLNKSEMLDFYNKIDIYISTSLSDGGLSSSTAEAMSFERLIIITDNSDNKLWVKNGQNGYLFKNKDYKNLAKIIEMVLKTKEKNMKVATSARTIINEKYNYKTEMNKVKNIYEIFK